MMKKLLVLLVVFTGVAPAATIVVNNTEFLLPAADDGFCTVHEAAAAANNNIASGAMVGECLAGEAMPVIDVIEFDASILPAHIDIANPIELSESIEFRGPGRELLYFTNQLGTRVFKIQNIPGFVEFMISDLSLVNNVLDPSLDDKGGALSALISADTQLTLNRVFFDNNRADAGGGAMILAGFPGVNNRITIRDCHFSNNNVNSNNETVFGGGAIFMNSSLKVKIENSTFFNNSASSFGVNPELVSGGAILIRSNETLQTKVSIVNSTFTNNYSSGYGGAIAVGGLSSVVEGSDVTIAHTTITQNQSDTNIQLINGSGGGVYSDSIFATELLNTIVADNIDNGVTNAPDLKGDFISLGYNFIGDHSTVTAEFPLGQPNINDDLVGNTAAPLDPLLSSLDDNGGPNLTRMPMVNSAVIDHGKCDDQTSDQRNFYNSNTGNRIFDNPNISNSLNGCDIGAVERNTSSANPIPEPMDDDYEILEGQSLLKSVANGVLSNDSDNNPLVVFTPHAFEFNGSSIVGLGTMGIYGDINFISNDADANGQAEIQYTVSDQSNEASANMSLTILPVNDAPSFNASTATIPASTVQAQTHFGWATDISVGPANESSQTAEFIVTAIPASGFFAAGPAVESISGDLMFTLLNSASGTADVTVLLKDSGGVSNGGQDFSTAVSFSIEVDDDIIFKNGFE